LKFNWFLDSVLYIESLFRLLAVVFSLGTLEQ